MQRRTTIATWCERIIEGGWLLALVLIPTYFNLLSARHFEPDKATTLRAIVLIMLAAGVVRALETIGGPTQRSESQQTANPLLRAWRRLAGIPLAVPALVYVLVFLLATVVSLVPGTSFWGSYQRLQGTYTNLSYIALASLIVFTLRRREQLERLITVGLLASLIAVGYGLAQHFQVDPLPWKGDVVSRVASTMGNSIFVAAYLIMVLPFAIYRAVAAFDEARRTPPETGADATRGALGWAAAYVLLVLGSLVLVFAAIKFGAVVRTADLRYWWIYPGALICAFMLYLIPTMRPHAAERISAAVVWPGVITLLYASLVGLFYLMGQASASQVVQPIAGRGGTDWGLWMAGGVVLIGLAYVLFFTLPRHSGPPSRMFATLHGVGMLAITLLILLTIFFTQSRGPWIGGAVGLFIFFTLLLWQALRRARARGAPHARLWRNLLIGEIALAVMLGVFVVTFNFSNAPFFQRLREVPYIGRMGQLLETSTGTGLVRRLIWIGDDKAGGAVALITADPLRTIVGWGPESMFVAFNRFYPPSLANIESRGASPDRSHEAYLDELVTKGVLGLISYLFVVISFFALAWQLLRRVDEWRMQVLFIACIAVVVAHSVEGLTGIPIVSTLMLLWMTMAVLVVAGALAGQYPLGTLTPVAVEAPAPEPVATPSGRSQSPGRGGKRRQAGVARGAAQGRAINRRAGQGSNPASLAIYAIIWLLALVGVWSFNLDNVYADMRFQQGQSYAENPNANLDQQLVGMSYFLDAIRMEPAQDFYYLNLGRSLMNITDIRRQTPGVQLGQPKPDARVEDLLRLPDTRATQQFVLQLPPLETISYARAVLERANQLNPLNKDHQANLGRLHNFWYSRLTRDPELLRQSVEWYRKGHEIAPQDVVILNEYASAMALLGSHLQSQGDPAAQQHFDQALALLERSRWLDPNYGDTDLRIADLQRIQGRAVDATDRYVALIERNPHALDTQLGVIIDTMQGQPDQLRRLRDAYTTALARASNDAVLHSFVGMLSVRIGEPERAVEAYAAAARLEPQNLDTYRNYTLILSDTKRYREAADAAQTLLALAQQQQAPEEERAAIESLLNYLRQSASTAGG